jgi:hypothetical protein
MSHGWRRGVHRKHDHGYIGTQTLDASDELQPVARFVEGEVGDDNTHLWIVQRIEDLIDTGGSDHLRELSYAGKFTAEGDHNDGVIIADEYFGGLVHS